MKRVICALIIFSAGLFLSVPAAAEQVNWISEEDVSLIVNSYDEYYKTGERDKLQTLIYDLSDEIGGPGYLFFHDNVADFINKTDKVIKVSYEVFTTGNRTVEETINHPLYNPFFNFVFFTSDYKEYVVKCSVSDRTVYSIDEILEGSGIDDLSKIKLAGVSWNSDNGSMHITDISLQRYVPGWNRIDGQIYYIGSDGAVAARTQNIGGIRYKFTQDGICHGKYTGFTRYRDGIRYYDNGVLVKNQWITTKGGKKYYASEDGKVC